MVTPALYEMTVGHTRRAPIESSFRHRSYMWLFDLDAPPRLPGPLVALARFRPSDHLDIRALLAAHGIEADRIAVLTNTRVLGYVFNPISIYWCHGPTGRLVAHVAEVHNTYGGRHAYVMPVDGEEDAPPAQAAVSEAAVAKAMYVSPFYPVDGSYRIRVGHPGETLSVSVHLERPGGDVFRAALRGRRLPASAANVARALIRYPAAPLRGRALIQYQGLRLWRRGLEVQPR